MSAGVSWTGTDGWPREWPEALEPAIRGLPGGAKMPAQTIAHYAKRLAIAADLGRRMEKPAGRNASRGETDKSLELLHDQCEKLLATIAGLKRPASEALAREGASLFVLQSILAETQQAARHCHSYTDAPEVAKSRPPKVEARHVTHEAARIYAEITMVNPTYSTKDSGNGGNWADGAWIDFLQACFDALRIKASAGAQAKAWREQSLQE